MILGIILYCHCININNLEVNTATLFLLFLCTPFFPLEIYFHLISLIPFFANILIIDVF